MSSPIQRPTLFFDRDVGTRLPETLGMLRLPVDIEYHQNHFPGHARDEDWMPEVGRRGWTLIGLNGQRRRDGFRCQAPGLTGRGEARLLAAWRRLILRRAAQQIRQKRGVGQEHFRRAVWIHLA